MDRTENAGGGTREEHGHRSLCRSSCGDDASVGLHDQKSAVPLVPLDSSFRLAQVLSAVWLDHHVEKRCHRPLVLAVLGQHGRGEGHTELREASRGELTNPPLVIAVRVGVQQADGDAIDASSAESLERFVHALLVQRLELLASEVEPTANLLDEV